VAPATEPSCGPTAARFRSWHSATPAFVVKREDGHDPLLASERMAAAGNTPPTSSGRAAHGGATGDFDYVFSTPDGAPGPHPVLAPARNARPSRSAGAALPGRDIDAPEALDTFLRPGRCARPRGSTPVARPGFTRERGRTPWRRRRRTPRSSESAASASSATWEGIAPRSPAASCACAIVARRPSHRFPTERVYGRTREPTLRVVSCSGDFDAHTGHYTDNTIVFADAA